MTLNPNDVIFVFYPAVLNIGHHTYKGCILLFLSLLCTDQIVFDLLPVALRAR